MQTVLYSTEYRLLLLCVVGVKDERGSRDVEEQDAQDQICMLYARKGAVVMEGRDHTRKEPVRRG